MVGVADVGTASGCAVLRSNHFAAQGVPPTDETSSSGHAKVGAVGEGSECGYATPQLGRSAEQPVSEVVD